MQRFRNILACVHTSGEGHHTLERAVQLAKSNDASLKVVTVHEELPKWARMLLPPNMCGWETAVVREADKCLEELVGPIRDAGVTVDTAVLVGIPFIEIIREVLRNSHDIVLKDLDINEGTGRPTIQSTDMHLLRKCPCPVWLVKPTPHSRFEQILAAVDPEPGDEVRNSLNTTILELATSLSKLERCKLSVVRAWKSTEEVFAAHKLALAEYGESLSQIEMTRRAADRELMAKFEATSDEFRVLHVRGAPESVIAQVAEDEAVDLVIMGTVARTGIRGLLMGNTAESVLRKIECSVLAVKPEGFVSPVSPA